jgi:hypothetical protein
MKIEQPDGSVVHYSPRGKTQSPTPPKIDFSRLVPHTGETLKQYRLRIAGEERSSLTIAERLEEDLFRYSLNKRDKEVSTVTLFYVPDKIRDCIPFVAKAVNARKLPGNQGVYCCALEKGGEILEKHHGLTT